MQKVLVCANFAMDFIQSYMFLLLVDIDLVSPVIEFLGVTFCWFESHGDRRN
jgi:hypothetical protein